MTKVFKIPDGEGGTRYRIQTPDGLWHDTDESGNLLGEDPVKTEEKQQAGMPSPVSISPTPKGRSRPVKQPDEKGRRYVNFSIQISQEDYKLLSDYVHWRSLFKEECSRGGFLLKLGLDTIRKDREFRDFLSKAKMQ